MACVYVETIRMTPLQYFKEQINSYKIQNLILTRVFRTQRSIAIFDYFLDMNAIYLYHTANDTVSTFFVLVFVVVFVCFCLFCLGFCFCFCFVLFFVCLFVCSFVFVFVLFCFVFWHFSLDFPLTYSPNTVPISAARMGQYWQFVLGP